MGTKVEYSINFLPATSVDGSNLTVKSLNAWEYHQNIGIIKLQYPMERMLDRNNIESIKKAMKMHEDIFKHQVRELHRVYSVQKMLMDELKKEIRENKSWTPMNGLTISQPNLIDQHHKTAQMSCGSDFHVQSLRDHDLCSRERSGSCSGDTIKMPLPRGFDLEMPAEKDINLPGERGFDKGEAGPSSHTAFQSGRISCDGSDKEMEVDLTLSIGGISKVKKKAKPSLPQLGCSDSPNGKISLRSDRVGECSDPTTPMSNSSVTFDQERKEPYWPSQGFKA